MNTKNNPLFSNFNPVTKQEWLEKVNVDLKGEDFNRKLVWKNLSNIDFQPFYNAEDKLAYLTNTGENAKALINYRSIEVSSAESANKLAIKAVSEGVTGFYPYNNMLMPTGFGHPEEEYWRIINGVSMWDVAVERQVELNGPDASKLAQILCPRDLTKCREGQGKYVALCNHDGVIINDPILLKLSENRFWLSIADNNIVLFARAVAAERGLNVTVFEALVPSISPIVTCSV